MLRLVVFAGLFIAVVTAASISSDVEIFSSGVDETQKIENIVGGNNARIEDFPYQVALVMMDATNKDRLCGGSIISQQYILTAAHCTFVVKHDPKRCVFRVGNANRLSGREIRPSQITPHPRFDGTKNEMDYDVAIAQLSQPLTFGPTIQSVRIPDVGENYPVGKAVTASGWGLTKYKGERSTNLQQVTGAIKAPGFCAQYLHPTTNSPRLTCFFGNFPDDDDEDGEGVCQGDSGGPVVDRRQTPRTQIGIISGVGNGICGMPSYFTRLTDPEIRPFIKKVTGI